MKLDLEKIKKLREATGAGVGDCREALEHTGGDLEKAADWLKKKAAERADKKAEREVKAGRVFVYEHHTGRLASVVALACETDFVAKNQEFERLGKELAMQVAAARPETVEQLLEQEYVRDPGKSVGQLIKETIGKLGENMLVAEFKVVEI